MATAFGKVILLGEHAVVYGVPALAAGIERGAEARAEARAPGARSRLAIEGWGSVEQGGDDSDLARAFGELLASSGVGTPFEVTARSDLPPASGLGCSAALGVAIGRALGEAAGAPLSLDESIDRAMAWERVFHGNPSGVDATVSARGGCVYFTRGEPACEVFVRDPLVLAIGHTGVGSSTKTMVEAVARLKERRPELVAKSLEAIRVLVRNARLAIEEGDLVAVGQLMDLNQMLLSGLLLSTTEIEQLCAVARARGALGAKLTGGGGGGCVIALCRERPDEVLAGWKEAGYEGFASQVSPRAGRR